MAVLRDKRLADRATLDRDSFDPSDTEVGALAYSVSLDGAPAGNKPEPITGALIINGTGADDTLVITATGTNSGTYSLNGGPAIAFSHVTAVTFSGGSGNDNMVVHNPDGGLFAPVDGVFVHGGTQSGGAGDGLAIEGGATDTAIYTTDAHHADGKDGSIVLSHGAVTATYTYTGLEPLANSGTATNIVFNLPAGADTAFLEDDGIAGNNMSRLRSGNGTFETTVFTHPTGSLTINSGTGDSVTINLVDSLNSADLTIGSLTNSAVNPDSIAVGSLSTDHTVTLATTGAITELGSDTAVDLTYGFLAMRAGTGIGVGNSIETSGIHGIGFGYVEAQTDTGGIFFADTSLIVIGGVTSTLTGLKVNTSGNINVSAAHINLSDTDGTEIVRGGSVSGDIILRSTGGLTVDVNNRAIIAPGGLIDVRVGEDILLGTNGANFDNDVRASGGVFLRGERDVIIDGLSNVIADDFGMNTGGTANIQAGRNITLDNAHGNGASIGANGTAGGAALLFAGPGGFVTLNAPSAAALFSNSGNVAVNANRLAISSASGIFASSPDHFVIIQPVSTSGWGIDLGSTSDAAASTLELSDAELDRITTPLLRIGETANPGNIRISSQITSNNHYQTLSLRTGGAIVDATAAEQTDLTVANLAMQAGTGIGDAGDLDIAVSNLAFSNSLNMVNITNAGSLTLTAVDTLASSVNTGLNTTVTAAGAMRVAADLTSSRQLALNTIDSAAAGEDITILPGVTVQSGNTIFVQAGDNIDLQPGSTVWPFGSLNLIADVGNADPGIGGIHNVKGTLLGSVAAVGNTSSGDPDTVNITPSDTSQIFTGGAAPYTAPGDTITVDTAGTIAPTLRFTTVVGDSKYGDFTFVNRQGVFFTEFDTVNVINGPLIVNGSSFNDAFDVNSSGPGSGNFALTGAFLPVSTLNDESETTVFNFGVPNTATYGQVITADAAHSKLSAFTFEMTLPSTVAFRGEVYAWDGTKATGPALFESAVMSTSGTGTQLVTFNAGGITLTPGQQYVLFASTSKDQAGHGGGGSWGATTTNAYFGGQFVFLNNGNDPSQWTTQSWSTLGGIPDLEFTAWFDQTATGNFSNLTSLSFSGLDGNDTYLIDNAGVVVTENPNQGNDVVYSSVPYTLPANVDALVLVEGAGNIDGAGNNDPNFLAGNSGNNALDGLGGNDFMQGGAGDDVYVIDSTSDFIQENPGAGNDVVHATVDYTVGANIESVILDGTGNINAVGSSDPNALIGNSGNNTLDGRGGNDFMVGGAGNDIYFIDSTSDFIQENPGQGNDVVHTTVDYTIGPNIESVILDGTGNINAAGNSQPNALVGNSGNNTLDGAGGDDFMQGGAGNDIYFVDSSSDFIQENPGEGNDIVHASVDFTIGANVESVILDGTGNINAAGSAGDNALVGNSGNNTLDGKGLHDLLTGNAGNDTFVFAAGEAGGDVVVDFAGNGGGAGDSFRFVGFGTAAQGATFTQIVNTNQWQIHSGLDSHNEMITLQNGAAVDTTDYVFV